MARVKVQIHDPDPEQIGIGKFKVFDDDADHHYSVQLGDTVVMYGHAPKLEAWFENALARLRKAVATA